MGFLENRQGNLSTPQGFLVHNLQHNPTYFWEKVKVTLHSILLRTIAFNCSLCTIVLRKERYR